MRKTILTLTFLTTLFLNGQTPAAEETGQTSKQIEKVKVFPNPATNVVNILGLLNTPKAEITVRDVNGNIALYHHWAIRKKALNIPVSNLRPGIYSISIRSSQQHLVTKFYKR